MDYNITMRDIVRCLWISQLQDYYGITDDGRMEDIIAEVDAKLCDIPDEELGNYL